MPRRLLLVLSYQLYKPGNFYAVKNKKRGLMIKAAIGYMHKSQHENAIRFDILSVILRGGKDPQIDHFKDAFFPDLAE